MIKTKEKLCSDCKYLLSVDEEICNSCKDKSRWVENMEYKQL